MTLLLAVLAIAYIGSMLMQGRALRGVGLPSGAEWMLLGLALGPHMLGVLDRGVLTAFEPVAAVAIGWLPLALGARFGRSRRERSGTRAIAFGMVFSALTATAVAAGVYGVALGLPMLVLLPGPMPAGTDLWIVAIGAGLVSCELTRHAVNWVIERYDAKGPLATFMGGVAEGSAIVPLLGTAVPFALAAPSTELALPWWGLTLVTLGLGVVLAMMCGALLWLEPAGPRSWGVLLGAALLGIGIAFRFGLSPITAMFVLGLALAVASTKRRDVHSMLSKTEDPVRLPILLLAGAQLSPHLSPNLLPLVGAAVLARVIGALLCAFPLSRISDAKLAGATRLRSFAFALLPAGSVTMTIGLAFALQFPDHRGALVLLIASLQTVLGEVLGPVALHRALTASEELPPDPESGSTHTSGGSTSDSTEGLERPTASDST